MAVVAEAFTTKLAAEWHRFVACDKRLETLGPFLIRRIGVDDIVLDACMGIGCEVEFLLRCGRSVVGNEVDTSLFKDTRRRLDEGGLHPRLFSMRWQDFDAEESGRFDVVLLLGNSLCLELNRRERLRALEGVARLLKPGGRVIVDRRNFEYILDSRVQILAGEFRYSREYMYCGQSLSGAPVRIADDLIEFAYRMEGEEVGRLSMYPVLDSEMLELLGTAGAKHVEKVSDLGYSTPATCDFMTYVAKF